MAFFIVLNFVKSFVWDCSVFTQYIYYCDLFFFGDSIAYFWSPSSFVSVIYRYYDNYGLVYVININTHDLFFYLYYMRFRSLQGYCLYSLLFSIHFSFLIPIQPRLFAVIVWLYCIPCQQYRLTVRPSDLHTHR